MTPLILKDPLSLEKDRIVDELKEEVTTVPICACCKKPALTNRELIGLGYGGDWHYVCPSTYLTCSVKHKKMKMLNYKRYIARKIKAYKKNKEA